ncbi:MAG: O-antigen ligase family protein [Verrucomicrobia bacterium]|nr:O-antigen ligase family protein [Verrucomicrobiota bacterium]
MPTSPPPAAPPPPRWEWLQVALVVGALAWTTVFNGGYGARFALVTLGLVAALVVLHAWAWFGDVHRSVTLHPGGWALVPFLVYALANVIWVTPVPWLGWFDWLNWAQLAAVFWVVLNGVRSRRPRWVLFHALVALALIEVLVGCYQKFVQPEWKMIGAARGSEFFNRASGTFSIPNSLAGFFLLLFPAVAALAFRRVAGAAARVWWGWVGLVLLLGLGLTVSRGAWLALAAALIAWPLLVGRRSWKQRVGIALAVLVVLGAVGALVGRKFPEARQRFNQLALDGGEKTRPILWRAAWALFQEAPAFGTGAGSFNVRFEPFRPERFWDEPMWAHNEYLNTLSDYGLAGGVLLAVGVIGIGLGCLRRKPAGVRAEADPVVTGGLAVGLLAFGLQLLVDFHLKIPALALAASTVAALAVGRSWLPPTDPAARGSPRSVRFGALAGVGVGVAAVLLHFVPLLRAESRRSEAARLLDPLLRSAPASPDYARVVPQVRQLLREATQLAPAHADAWADLARATTLLGFVHPDDLGKLGREAEEAADRALAVSTVPWEFWVRRGVARDLQGRWADAGTDFAAAVKCAPMNANAWYYWAEHLFRSSFTHEVGEAALRTCLRLDPWNSAGVALRQRLAKTTKAP